MKKGLLLMAAVVMAVTAGRAQAQADITLDQAYAVVVAAKAKAEELGIEVWDEARLLSFLESHP